MMMTMMIFDEKDKFWAVRSCRGPKGLPSSTFRTLLVNYHSQHGCESTFHFCSYYPVWAVMGRCQIAELVPNVKNDFVILGVSPRPHSTNSWRRTPNYKSTIKSFLSDRVISCCCTVRYGIVSYRTVSIYLKVIMWAVRPSIPVTKPNDPILIFTLKNHIPFTGLVRHGRGVCFWLLSASIVTYLKIIFIHLLCY